MLHVLLLKLLLFWRDFDPLLSNLKDFYDNKKHFGLIWGICLVYRDPFSHIPSHISLLYERCDNYSLFIYKCEWKWEEHIWKYWHYGFSVFSLHLWQQSRFYWYICPFNLELLNFLMLHYYDPGCWISSMAHLYVNLSTINEVKSDFFQHPGVSTNC